MPISPVGHDAVSAVLGTTLDGLAMRRDVIADNIANVDTPGFRASTVDFESALRGVVETGEPRSVALATIPTNTPVGADGNNVDLRHEAMAAMQTQYQYQVMTRAMSDRFQLITTAAGAS
ncbi:flagellar basal body rod protein FlgB [Nocardioides sp. SYSU DS0663]|uniref:flagellar basal body rod protein FlgB n=1 Tax=Nocardioides sp. SYSU DS0663 TaxID=3416445 RepID=UPI003F4B3AA3